ncbi:MAG: S-layer homology domain-containing protein [Candidatus Margulisiibacteriota bacterium]
MRKIIIKALIICLAAFGGWSAALAVDGIGLDPASTLYSARQLGLGGAALGFADDASGVFANPAGMTNIKFPQLLAASRKLVFDETQYTLLCWSLPTDLGIFGLGYTSLNTGGSPATQRDPATTRIIIAPSQEATGFDNNVLALSYSRKVRPDLAVGGALKLFNQALRGGVASQANGTGLDLSASYHPLSWLTAAANLQNILEGTLKWTGGSADKIGGFYKLGCKVYLLGSSTEAWRAGEHDLYGGLDLDIPHSSLASTAYHLGLDYSPVKNVFIRSGLNIEGGGLGLALGVGVVNGGFRFDYAYAQRNGLSGDTPHYFSLSYLGERVMTFAKKLTAKRPLLKFLSPRDRLITDQETIEFTAEAWALRLLDQKRTWTVTAVSETSDAYAITSLEALAQLTFNGQALTRNGTFEGKAAVAVGRNVIQLAGFTSPEVVTPQQIFQAVTGSAELHVLRIEPFRDTPLSFWAIEPISLNSVLGLVNGYPDNSFKPDKGITRAELVTLLVRSLGLSAETLEPHAQTELFRDVTKKHWAIKYINYGNAVNYVTGYPDKSFQPNKVLTRAEGVTILARYANLIDEAVTTNPFPDLLPGYWANKFIEPAKKAGLLNYLAGKDFQAAAPFTRAEACEVLYRVPNIQKMVEEYWESGIVSGGR